MIRSRWIENQVKEAKITKSEVVAQAARTFDEREALQKELEAHQRNLHQLKLQAANYGAPDVPLRLLNQIEDEQRTVDELREKLGELH